MWEITDETVVQRQSKFFAPRAQNLDLHAGHVDAGWTFAAAGLAGDAEF
jgi:hypothetical protein